MYCYYAPDERRERGGLEMVSMVKFPLCARVSVHFKKAYFAYFVAYIAHSSVSVIGDISRRFDWLTCDLFHKSKCRISLTEQLC